MIFGNIKDAHRYYSVNPYFGEAFKQLAALSEGNIPESGISTPDFRIVMPNGRSKTFDLNEDGSERELEAHRDFLDIHYCIAGSECIGYNDIDRLTPTMEYDGENDYLMLKGEYYRLTLHPGDFCIVFPEDAHLPMLQGDGDGTVLKAIVKIRV